MCVGLGWEISVYHFCMCVCMCVVTGWSIKVMGVIVAFWDLVLHLTTKGIKMSLIFSLTKIMTNIFPQMLISIFFIFCCQHSQKP